MFTGNNLGIIEQDIKDLKERLLELGKEYNQTKTNVLNFIDKVDKKFILTFENNSKF